MNINKKEALFTTLIVSIVVYALLAIVVTSNSKMIEKIGKVIGNQPFGISIKLYILVFIATLCIPLLFFFWHIYVTVNYAKRKRSSIVFVGNIGAFMSLVLYLKFLLQNDSEPLEIKRSKIYTFIGILYLIGIVIWWIIWSAIHGL